MKKSKSPKITEEDFSAWRDNAITQAVFSHLQENAKAVEVAWGRQLKAETPLDPTSLQLRQVEFKSKLEFIEDMLAIELSDIQEQDEAGRGNRERKLVTAGG